MILGLDISTTTIGYTIIDEDGLHDIGYISLGKQKGLVEKAAEAQRQFIEIYESYGSKITLISIEENLQSFRSGFSSAKVLMKLGQFNGIIQWITSEIFNVPIASFNVNTARKTVGLKVDRKSHKTTKDQVLEWAINDNPEISWPTKKLSRGKNKGKIVMITECYDMADAYVIGKASLPLIK